MHATRVLHMTEIPTVKVLFADPAALLGTGAGAMACLDAADLAHVARFRFARDREVAAASRVVQRIALARAAQTGLDPGLLRFEANASGRPHVAAPTSMQRWRFSASNTIGLVGCAVSMQLRIGFDVERNREEAPEDLLAWCCTEGERRALAQWPAEERGTRFTALWARKESYLKARGVGLALPPSAFGFEPGSGEGLRVTAVADEEADGWQVLPLDAGPAHAAALCVAGAAMPLPRIDVEWVCWREHGVAFSATAP